MVTHRLLARRVLVVILLSIAFLLGTINAFPAKADNPPDDGRINKLPWINSFGAVAVYCIDQSGKPGSTYQGNGILVLSGTGQRLLFASDVQIDQSLNWLTNFANVPAQAAGSPPANAPMCVDTSFSARTNSVVDEFLIVQKQADALTAKFNLGPQGRIVAPDLSPVIFGTQALDHLLREVDLEHSALGTRIVALQPTVLALQNGVQAAPQKIAGTLAAIDDFDAQLNSFVGALSNANVNTFSVSKQLGAVPLAIQTTADYTQTQLAGLPASMKIAPNGQDETAQYLTMLANTRQKVGAAAAGISSLNFQLFSLKTRIAGVRTQLAQLRKQVQALAPTDSLGAANAAASLNALMSSVQSDSASMSTTFKATCKAPQGSPNAALLARQGVYSLYVLPGGLFQLSTVPDASGNTVLGRWQACGPVTK